MRNVHLERVPTIIGQKTNSNEKSLLLKLPHLELKLLSHRHYLCCFSCACVKGEFFLFVGFCMITAGNCQWKCESNVYPNDIHDMSLWLRACLPERP